MPGPAGVVCAPVTSNGHQRQGRPAPAEKVCLRDVAAAAGVSLTTASHALNAVQAARVAPATVARVREVAQRLGYRARPEPARERSAGTVGVLGLQLTSAPHSGRVLQGIGDACHRLGVDVVLRDADDDSADREAELLLRHDVRGVLVVTRFHREIDLPRALAGTRVVVVDARCAAPATACVVPDDERGGHDAVAFLLASGHRRIGLLSNRDDIPATHARLRGAAAALEAAGLAWDPRMVTCGPPDAGGGREAAGRLLDLAEPPTAFFCFNDAMAAGAYQAICERGLHVPGDVSVIGYDDESRIAASLFPPLTTVGLPHYELGRHGVERLLDASPTPWPPAAPDTMLVACPLVRRASVDTPKTFGTFRPASRH